MELNININFGITPELKETVNDIIKGRQASIVNRIGRTLLGAYIKHCEAKDEASAPEEAPESQSPAQPEGASAGSPSAAPAEEAPAPKRVRRSKKAEAQTETKED